ncbi:helix-turn-helix domain-containing protein [Aeromonas caviae]|uniref:helix-turn-helix domain-containing protein n=1 Tax=Aeromonas caviae TaxID=648 RepID=UPI00214ED8FA|nr:XRE family transcriptional regulator [Aeromonas caviae]MCR3895048.1 XRE family transcriptional regulator [Aeromonas caviae]WEE22308.1 XRE family transcriptional regulator [Aeromonas caviae]BDS32410.1 DNA-binding protein [Aeromonas caviae]
MQEMSRYLAQRLKGLRTERGWSLDMAARETGVSKAMLGQIERGESSPTVATLWKIATGFRVSFSSFIEPTPEAQGETVYRIADDIRQQPAGEGMQVAPLFPYEARFGFELFELTLLPGYQRESEPHEPGVTEHVIVISGVMEVLVDGAWRYLDQGEAVRFAADRPHGYRNLGVAPAIFHNLIHYPVMDTR